MIGKPLSRFSRSRHDDFSWPLPFLQPATARHRPLRWTRQLTLLMSMPFGAGWIPIRLYSS